MCFIKHSCAVSSLCFCDTFTLCRCHKYILVQCHKFSIPVRKPMEDQSLSPLVRNSLYFQCWTLQEVHTPNHSEMWICFRDEGSVPLCMWLRIMVGSLSSVPDRGTAMTGAKWPKTFLWTINAFKNGCIAPCFALMLLPNHPNVLAMPVAWIGNISHIGTCESKFQSSSGFS